MVLQIRTTKDPVNSTHKSVETSKAGYGGKAIWKRRALSLVWKHPDHREILHTEKDRKKKKSNRAYALHGHLIQVRILWLPEDKKQSQYSLTEKQNLNVQTIKINICKTFIAIIEMRPFWVPPFWVHIEFSSSHYKKPCIHKWILILECQENWISTHTKFGQIPRKTWRSKQLNRNFGYLLTLKSPDTSQL